MKVLIIDLKILPLLLSLWSLFCDVVLFILYLLLCLHCCSVVTLLVTGFPPTVGATLAVFGFGLISFGLVSTMALRSKPAK